MNLREAFVVRLLRRFAAALLFAALLTSAVSSASGHGPALRGSPRPNHRPSVITTAHRSTPVDLNPARWKHLVPAISPTARALELDGYILWGVAIVARIAFFAWILSRGRARRIQSWFEARKGPIWVWRPLCLLSFILMYQTWLVPLSFAGYLIDRHYGIAVQSSGRWASDVLRSWAIDDSITVLVLLGILYLMRRSPRRWWIGAGALVTALSFGMVYLAPIAIDPLFHRFRPLGNPDLKASILELAARSHLRVTGVYVGEFSSTTTEGNAYVTGIGSSQRIVIWDTLLKKFPPDEVRSIVAHEMGHYALHHLFWGTLFAALGSFALLFLAACFLEWLLTRGWLRAPGELIAIVPLAALLISLNLLALPVVNSISRVMESQADAFSLRITGRPDWFVQAMQRLAKQDFDDPWPSPFAEVVFYSHPSVAHRIFAAVQFAQAHPAAAAAAQQSGRSPETATHPSL